MKGNQDSNSQAVRKEVPSSGYPQNAKSGSRCCPGQISPDELSSRRLTRCTAGRGEAQLREGRGKTTHTALQLLRDPHCPDLTKLQQDQSNPQEPPGGGHNEKKHGGGRGGAHKFP